MSEVEVPYDYTDKEIKNYIEERYSTGKIESITKVVVMRGLSNVLLLKMKLKITLYILIKMV